MPKRTPTFKFDGTEGEARLRELILYVASRCQSDPKFGATKLNKILWWADFLAYAEFGRPITGLEYMRLGNGPVPRRLLPVRDDMERKAEVVLTSVETLGGHTQKRIVPLRKPNLAVFSAEEISLVDNVISALWKRTARGVSTLSHGKAWEVADDRGGIPYEAVFLSDKPNNRYDVSRTKELARQFNWSTV